MDMAADTPSGHIISRRIDIGRITLNVREKGSGPLMLFFHGITSNSAVFEPLMARLSDRFTTIAVDQRGHGHSDKPEAGYEANDYADDIAGLIRTLDRGPAILVGHSLGARNSVTAAPNTRIWCGRSSQSTLRRTSRPKRWTRWKRG